MLFPYSFPCANNEVVTYPRFNYPKLTNLFRAIDANMTPVCPE